MENEEKGKEFKDENLNGNMAEKRKIRGECYEVRERNTSGGKKGTIIRKCPKPIKKKKGRIIKVGEVSKLFR